MEVEPRGMGRRRRPAVGFEALAEDWSALEGAGGREAPPAKKLLVESLLDVDALCLGFRAMSKNRCTGKHWIPEIGARPWAKRKIATPAEFREDS